eukprot:CAMPEP_0201506064 /NCGR_PEP_ID=MMETSP0151_2-20130828/86138_1 /ASSEMBLY_ACC=CAM_ASM_000257 /TAXON_ID=200890 /ORGANISM="Paramoeba atlantica, Strain 621/1 / CCAP 1560/9" /LENGTH=203 /DNA_ID=CAMNT_0047900045 /DNA_START=1478 /DNA_END=2089 /DNA_ORIENTATION=-
MTKALDMKYSGQPFPTGDREIEDMGQKYQQAIAIGKDQKTSPARFYFFYALFLKRCHEIEKADINFLKAIKLTPYCPRYIYEYSVFLRNEGNSQEFSFVMHLRAKLISELMSTSLEMLQSEGDNVSSILERCDDVVDTHAKQIRANEFYSRAANFEMAYGCFSREQIEYRLAEWEKSQIEQTTAREPQPLSKKQKKSKWTIKI